MSELATSNGQAGFLINANGLTITDPDLPYEHFHGLCAALGQWHEIVRFAIGDALLIGPELYGDEAYQAFEAMHLSEDARLEYRRVASQVPRSRRRKGLSWSHHRAVASLEPAEQKTWLRRAAEEGLSHHALRDALRTGDTGLPPPDGVPRCRCCGRALDA